MNEAAPTNQPPGQLFDECKGVDVKKKELMANAGLLQATSGMESEKRPLVRHAQPPEAPSNQTREQ